VGPRLVVPVAVGGRVTTSDVAVVTTPHTRDAPAGPGPLGHLPRGRGPRQAGRNPALGYRVSRAATTFRPQAFGRFWPTVRDFFLFLFVSLKFLKLCKSSKNHSK
jgi:hypothetical protein